MLSASLEEKNVTCYDFVETDGSVQFANVNTSRQILTMSHRRLRLGQCSEDGKCVIQADPLPKSAIRHVRCTQERETIPLPPGAPQGEAGWKPRDWLATRSIPLQ